MIQKMWRGYRSRRRTMNAVEVIHKQRTQEYIEKLTCDMATTKEALENERKIQQLQMQAINALWKKVSAMQQTTSAEAGAVVPDSGDGTKDLDGQVVADLARTCTVLTSQVQQLQGSMKDILNCMTMFCNLSQAKGEITKEEDCSHSTQTEIVAVHTPQTENCSFPFQTGKLTRPSTLELSAVNGKLDAHAEEASEENLEKIIKEEASKSSEKSSN